MPVLLLDHPHQWTSNPNLSLIRSFQLGPEPFFHPAKLVSGYDEHKFGHHLALFSLLHLTPAVNLLHLPDYQMKIQMQILSAFCLEDGNPFAQGKLHLQLYQTFFLHRPRQSAQHLQPFENQQFLPYASHHSTLMPYQQHEHFHWA